MAYYEGEIAPMGGGYNNNNGFGNGWEGLIGLALVAGLFDGGFGWGNGGGNGAVQGALTRGDLCQDMNFNDLESAVRGVQQGICDGFYAMNTGMLNGFGNVQQTLCQGFSGVNQAISTNGYETRGAIADLGYRLQDCCCQQKQIALENRYLNERQTCDLITNQNANTQRIIDYMSQRDFATLQSENAALKGQLSQNAQTSAIIGALSPKAPIPAYQVPNPYATYGGCCNSGCAC